MIRAVIDDGVIRPLEPLPIEWQDGHEVVVEGIEEQRPSEREGVDEWAEAMKMITADLNDPQEWRQIEAALADADRQNKALVRREMGLI